LSEDYFARLSTVLNRHTAIPPEEFDKLINITRLIQVKKDDYFTRAGEDCPWLGFIIKGVFRCFYLDETGTEYIKHFFQEDDFMVSNTQALIDEEPEGRKADYFIQALEDSLVLKIGINKFKGLFTLQPCWQKVFMKEIERVRRIEHRRVKQLLSEDAETRYANFKEDFPGLEERIKQAQIAAYLGISPVSLSRIRGKQQSI